jgi:hypothetical protein
MPETILRRAAAMAYGSASDHDQVMRARSRLDALAAQGEDTLVAQCELARAMTVAARMEAAYAILDDMARIDPWALDDDPELIPRPAPIPIHDLESGIPVHMAHAAARYANEQDYLRGISAQVRGGTAAQVDQARLKTRAALETTMQQIERWAAGQGHDATIDHSLPVSQGIAAEEQERRRQARDYVDAMLADPEVERQLERRDHLRGAQALAEVMALFALPYARRAAQASVEGRVHEAERRRADVDWAMGEGRRQMQDQLLSTYSAREVPSTSGGPSTAAPAFPEHWAPYDPLTRRNRRQREGAGR